ncbi:2-amino-4-hydroxy-6-hydroxymethyldihydropteridine diphosphokinase [Novosphingobium sp.]|uniref:2-amino-4-hydroxy-6- hydroxymethyldihydropteridine diphosphokinase n=1 Tax=Novosphingobium sp. TaxID=1874826 RepID=UPI0035ADF2EB
MQRYLIALGSNKRHHRHGAPAGVLAAALDALAAQGIAVLAAAPVLQSAPLGPSRRRYANGAALIESELDPEELLALLKSTERLFGRRSGGQRWASRVLDLDIVLWSGGAWSSPDLTVPHKSFRQRGFVLRPARALAPLWRDPITGLSLNHLHARLTQPRRLRR